MNALIHSVLLEERVGAVTEYKDTTHAAKWLVDNERDLVVVVIYQKTLMLGYVEEFWAEYADAPRRWASVNTMVAHEHFMLRLPSLDEHLAALLRRLARGALQDSVPTLTLTPTLPLALTLTLTRTACSCCSPTTARTASGTTTSSWVRPSTSCRCST